MQGDKQPRSVRTGPIAEPHWTTFKDTNARRDAARREAAASADEERKEGRKRENRARVREEIKQRRAAERNLKPLGVLAGKEVALDRDSSAKSILGPSIPDLNLLSGQLQRLSICRGSSFLEAKERSDVMRLYEALEPQDAIKSILDRIVVATSMSTMDAFGNAARSSGRTRDMELRHGMKGVQVLTDLVKFRDLRRDKALQTSDDGILIEPHCQTVVGEAERPQSNIRQLSRKK